MLKLEFPSEVREVSAYLHSLLNSWSKPAAPERVTEGLKHYFVNIEKLSGCGLGNGQFYQESNGALTVFIQWTAVHFKWSLCRRFPLCAVSTQQRADWSFHQLSFNTLHISPPFPLFSRSYQSSSQAFRESRPILSQTSSQFNAVSLRFIK